jgi:hypothetical protein
MPDEPRRQPQTDDETERDSSEVVTGPIGGAHLVEPAKAEALGADLDELPVVDADDPEIDGSPASNSARR